MSFSFPQREREREKEEEDKSTSTFEVKFYPRGQTIKKKKKKGNVSSKNESKKGSWKSSTCQKRVGQNTKNKSKQRKKVL
jgi:hypothetical protein